MEVRDKNTKLGAMNSNVRDPKVNDGEWRAITLPFNVVITMRSDFLESCSDYPSLNKLIENQLVLMPRIAGVDLRETITEPAKLQGHSVEEGLF